MADVTLSLAAKDTGISATLQRIQSRLAAFNSSMGGATKISGKLSASFSGMTRSLVGLGTAYLGVSQAMASFNKALGMADRLDDLSKITGASAGDLAVLERAFENTGVGGDRMLPMLSKMTKFVQDLGKGNKEAEATAKMLGVSFEQLNRLAPIQRFNLLMRAIGGLTSENKQNIAAMDVFGVKGGMVATLLAKDFNGALNESRAQLGSLVEILNESGSTLGELNDLLKNSVFNKPTEFTIGFLAGVKGAKQFAKSLSEIDAAGFGQKIGKMFAGIAKDPGSGFLLFGEMLLLGVMKAGNALVDAVNYAGIVWQKYLTDTKAQKSLFSSLMATLGGLASWFNKMFYTIFKNALSLVDSVTGGWWPYAKESIAELKKLEKQFDNNAQAISEFGEGANSAAAQRLIEIAQSTPKPEPSNAFDVKDQQAQVDALAARLSQLGAATAKSDAEQIPTKSVTELNQIYNEQLKILRDANLSTDEFAKKLKQLNADMNQALRYYGARPPVQQAKDAAMPQPARDEAISAASGKSASAADPTATETTLQKAVAFLEELNTKLPQPVLV